MPSEEKRPYRQRARASAAEDLRLRIVDVFHDLMLTRWLDDITLAEVARNAETTQRTVIRLFGGKDGLLAETLEKRLVDQADARIGLPANASIDVSLAFLVDHYEIVGDFVLRLLAQEERQPLLRPVVEHGRRAHRQWVLERFCSGADVEARERLVMKLVVVTDVYTWKLLRRDRGQSRAEIIEIMHEFILSLTKGRFHGSLSRT